MFGSSQSSAVLGAPQVNGATAVDPAVAARGTDRPRPGDLGIRQKRSWRTWHLVVAVAVSVVLGMVIGNDTSSGGGGTGTSSNGAAKTTYTLPPPAGSGSSASSTTVPSSSTTTQAAVGGGGGAPSTTTTSSTPAGSGKSTILLPAKQASGNWTSPAFTVGAAPWSLGWAYQCTPAPAPGSAFEIFVDPAGNAPSTTPAVKETASSGAAVTSETSTGQQDLSVQAPTGCVWKVKVAGVP